MLHHATASQMTAPDMDQTADVFSTLGKLVNGVRIEQMRSSSVLHLTAYENQLSKLAQSFLQSNLSFRQHEGTFEDRHPCGTSLDDDSADVIRHGSFIFMGLPGVYALEREATDAAQSLFHAALSDFRPTSGLHAMVSTIAAATKPGHVIYTIDPINGGHSASRTLITQLGRQSKYIPWCDKTKSIDLDAFEKIIRTLPPNAIYFEHGTPLFPLPLRKVRKLVGPDVTIVYDASHTLGLIAGGQFQDPLREGCDILQGNTHKTFPGPQKALVNFKDWKNGVKIAQLFSNGFISSQHTHHSIALYITVLEMKAFAKAYGEEMLKNAAALAGQLSKCGFSLASNGNEFTKSHQILIRGKKGNADCNLYDECRRLFACGISTNARIAFSEPVIRIGVQEVTRRGMKICEMEKIARFFKRALIDNENVDDLRKEVKYFNEQFKNIDYSFDDQMGLNNH
jgi:glycine/serine hydroxymethyltransferase